jgi:hypothetical protein
MITVEQAHEMGAKGGPADEHERLLFEAWMKGHCWLVEGDWDGTTYRHESEFGGYLHPGAVRTRQLWAAWRDRAALAKQPTLQTCNCRWDGEVQVQQCTLHEAHVDAIHEWAERAKTVEAKLKAQSVAWDYFVGVASALIKAADDAAADADYMLDSDDCIKVLRGEWTGPMMNDCPQPKEEPDENNSVAIDRACFDRGCACFDPRIDKDAVIVEKRS